MLDPNPHIAAILELPKSERLEEAFATIRYLYGTDNAALLRLQDAYYLTKTQAKVLYILHRSPEKTARTDALLNALYADRDDEPSSNIIKVYICQIRKKTVHAPFEIETIYGSGYRLLGAIPELQGGAAHA